jgi:hypothetical protein
MLSVFPDITGSDSGRRGINVGADVLTTTIDGVDFNSIWAEYQAALNLWNSTRDPIIALFTYDTTNAAEALPLDGDTTEFEPASEFGVPKAGRADPKNFVAGYPLQWYDLAVRFTRKFLRDASRVQVDAQQTAALEASNRLQFREALRALVTPQLSGDRSINENGVPILSLYAGSTDDAPPSFAGRTFAPGHNHYLVSGAATIDGQDLEDVIEHITHHGYGIGTAERVVILVHPDQGKVIRGFAGSPYDFIPSEAAPAYLSSELIVGDLPPATFNGLPVIGSFGKALIVESYYAMSGYVVGVAVAGANSARNALALRSHPRPELKGLQIIPGETSRNYPLVEAGYQIGVGFGVRNRGAAVVMQVKASGSFVAPTI